jgi:two-component system phosphate regulon sensor histidine kinase PhoR
MKRVRPSSLAVLTSLFVSLTLTVICWLLFYLFSIEVTWYITTIIFLSAFLLMGLSFMLLYQKYILANLNQIYKNIIRLRSTNTAIMPTKDANRDLTSEINKILIDWSNESREEIDQLKQTENYRREFLTNVSHELKTPIFSIQGYVHTLIDGGIDDADVNIAYLNKASKSIDRLISIVDDLESISKLEAGELIIEPRTFDIADLAADVVESLEMQAKEKKMNLNVIHNPDRPLYVYADRDMIRQVLVNLIFNSIKYGKRDGTTEIRFSDTSDKVFTEVSDNGIGIEKEHLSRLFERFYRVDKSRSRDGGGTGLGLAIVKHIMEAHSEQISVGSEVGKGTTFTFSLIKSK